MDALSQILVSLSAQSYVTTGLSCGPRCAIAYPPFPGFKFLCIRKGTLYFRAFSDHQWIRLATGDALLMTKPTAFVIATDPELTPIPSSQMSFELENGLANYGGNDHVLIAGKMMIDTSAGAFFLQSLPAIIEISRQEDTSQTLSWLMGKLREELLEHSPGFDLIANHLMQLIMIEVLRYWAKKQGLEHHGIFQGLQNRNIQRALTALQNAPEKNWTLPELAQVAAMSRSNFSKIFKTLMGVTPMHYLTIWRVALACRVLRDSQQSIKDIALSLGFNSAIIFSNTFSRLMHCSPSRYRVESRKNAYQSIQTSNSGLLVNKIS